MRPAGRLAPLGPSSWQTGFLSTKRERRSISSQLKWHACDDDGAASTVGEVEAFANLASTHCEEDCATPCRICAAWSAARRCVDVSARAVELVLEIQAYGRKCGCITRLHHKMLHSLKLVPARGLVVSPGL